MEPSIARLLPCDTKVTDAISAVRQSSSARLAAQTAYLRALVQEDERETEAARRLLAAAQTLASELGEEKTDIAQEQAGVDVQLMDLAASVTRRPSLGESQAVLRQIAEMIKQRADLVQGGLNRREALTAAVNSLVSALQERDSARAAELSSLESESTRWNAYYAARMARAQTECSITKGALAPPAPARRLKGNQ